MTEIEFAIVAEDRFTFLLDCFEEVLEVCLVAGVHLEIRCLKKVPSGHFLFVEVVDHHPSVEAVIIKVPFADHHPFVEGVNHHPSVEVANRHPFVGVVDRHPSVEVADRHPFVEEVNHRPFVEVINRLPFTVEREDFRPFVDRHPSAEVADHLPSVEAVTAIVVFHHHLEVYYHLEEVLVVYRLLVMVSVVADYLEACLDLEADCYRLSELDRYLSRFDLPEVFAADCFLDSFRPLEEEVSSLLLLHPPLHH